jgi:hypothetical protein
MLISSWGCLRTQYTGIASHEGRSRKWYNIRGALIDNNPGNRMLDLHTI